MTRPTETGIPKVETQQTSSANQERPVPSWFGQFVLTIQKSNQYKCGSATETTETRRPFEPYAVSSEEETVPDSIGLLATCNATDNSILRTAQNLGESSQNVPPNSNAAPDTTNNSDTPKLTGWELCDNPHKSYCWTRATFD